MDAHIHPLTILPGRSDLVEVVAWLNRTLADANVSISIRQSEGWENGFSLEPATIIVSGTAVLSTVITSLVAYLNTRRTGTIKITSKDGRTLEFPRDLSPQQIAKIIDLAKDLEVDRIIMP